MALVDDSDRKRAAATGRPLMRANGAEITSRDLFAEIAPQRANAGRAEPLTTAGRTIEALARGSLVKKDRARGRTSWLDDRTSALANDSEALDAQHHRLHASAECWSPRCSAARVSVWKLLVDRLERAERMP